MVVDFGREEGKFRKMEGYEEEVVGEEGGEGEEQVNLAIE
jgi:hypothetical protein